MKPLSKDNTTFNFFKTAISIIVIILAVFMISTSLNINLKTNKKVLSYQNDAQIDYKVYLEANNDYSSSYQPSNQSYIASLIDEIITTIDYNFIADDKFDFTYTYEINAYLKAYDQNYQDQEHLVNEKSYNLVPKKEQKMTNSNGYKIKEVLAIDYKTYQAVAQDFALNHNVNLSSVLIIELTTKLEGIYAKYNEVITNSNKVTMEIPINEETIQITTQDDIDEEKNLRGNEEETFANHIMTIIGFVLLAGALFIVGKEGYTAYLTSKKESAYRKEIDSILKKYPNIMLKTAKLPTLKNKRTIEIANLEDLIELEKELKSGILVCEKAKKNETWFVLIHQNEVWIYIKKI